MKTVIAGVVLMLTAALLPAPKITIENPKLLYAAAMYETVTGDTECALRLVWRAEQALQSRAAGAKALPALQAACDRSTVFTAL